MRSNKNLTELFIHFVDDAGNVFTNDKLAEILAHESKLCDVGITNGSSVKGIFEANKSALDMRITSYDDNGDEVQAYDEEAYETACP